MDPKENGGWKSRMRWLLKPCKTDQKGTNSFQKTVLVNEDCKYISTAFAISCLLHKRGHKDYWDHINIPFLQDPNTG